MHEKYDDDRCCEIDDGNDLCSSIGAMQGVIDVSRTTSARQVARRAFSICLSCTALYRGSSPRRIRESPVNLAT